MPAHRTPPRYPRASRLPEELSDLGLREDGTLVKIPKHRRRRERQPRQKDSPWLIVLSGVIIAMMALQVALVLKAYGIAQEVDKGLAAITLQINQIAGQFGSFGPVAAHVQADQSLVTINPDLPAAQVQYLDHLPLSAAKRSAASDYLVAHPHIDNSKVTLPQFLAAWRTAQLDYNAKHGLPLETPLP